MKDNATFIKRKRSRLPIKYMRRSIKGFAKRPLQLNDVEQLQRIDEFYKEFIDYSW